MRVRIPRWIPADAGVWGGNVGAALLGCFLIVIPMAAGALGPAEVADEGVVLVVTTGPEGDAKETKIWIAVHEGTAYIRTGGSRWGKHVERNPNIQIRLDDVFWDVRAEFVTDETERAEITRVFRDKYGWSDRLVTPMRGRNPKIMRLRTRSSEE